jgi:hypothetical protein
VNAFENPNSVSELIKCDDPLSREGIGLLLAHREEDDLVDYKQTFHPDDDRHWLELTKDVMSFANTLGGYLVFGVRDGSFELLGLDPSIVAALGDSNRVQQKVNRHIEPEVTHLRCRTEEIDGRQITVLFVPPSFEFTHVVSKDGAFVSPDGKPHTLLRKGTIYVRRSGANHLADSRDLNEMFDRRLQRFREWVFNGVGRLIHAPEYSEVSIVPRNEAGAGKAFSIGDAPGAIPVKGLGFSTPPGTMEEEVAGWIAMSEVNSNAVPDSGTIYRWYVARNDVGLSDSLRLGLARFSLLRGTPVFYWLRALDAAAIREMLLHVVDQRGSTTEVGYVVATAAFLGRTFQRTMLGRLSKDAKRLDRKMAASGTVGPRTLVSPGLVESTRKIFKGSEQAFRAHLEADLTRLAQDGARQGELSDVVRQRRMRAYDCYLYAQDDRYAMRNGSEVGTRGRKADAS